MYVAAAETTKAIVNAIKPKNNTDKTHLGQFEYAVWVNVVSDSSDMVKRHGIFPQPKFNMSEVLPSLNVFYDHWTSCSSDTKQDVTKLIYDIFSKKAKLLTAVGQRAFGRQKTFDTKRPLHGIQLLLQAYKVRDHKKNSTVLEGGKYTACPEGPQESVRDTIHFNKSSEQPFVKATDFSEFSLVSNDVLLNPKAIAATIYISNSDCDNDKEKVTQLQSHYKTWKRRQGGESQYLHVKHVAVPEPGGGGGGGGSDKAHDSTRDIKSDLAKPLARLCKQYTQMFDILNHCDANVEAACTFLKNDMTETFKEVARLVDMSFTPPFTSIEDGSEKDKESDDDNERENNDDNKKKDGDGTSDGGNGSDTESDEERNAYKKTDCSATDNTTTPETLDTSTLTTCSRDDLTEFVAKFRELDGCDLEEVDIEQTKSKGASLKRWLKMRHAPKGPEQFRFFCMLRTKNKRKIEREYKNKTSKLSASDTWIKTFASFLGHIRKLHWSNSFENLPEGGCDEDNSILIWLSNKEFEEIWFPRRRASSRNKC